MLISTPCRQSSQKHELESERRSPPMAYMLQAITAEAWSGGAEDEALVSADMERKGPAGGAHSYGAAHKCGHQRRALGWPCILEVCMHSALQHAANATRRCPSDCIWQGQSLPVSSLWRICSSVGDRIELRAGCADWQGISGAMSCGRSEQEGGSCGCSAFWRIHVGVGRPLQVLTAWRFA